MAKFKIILYKWKQYNDGKYPIIIQLIHNRKRKVITLGYTATPEEWIEELGRFSKSVKNYKVLNQALESTELKAERIINEIKIENKLFSFELFQSRFSNDGKTISVFPFYEEIIGELLSIEKVNTANIYKSSFNIIRKFRNNKDLTFYDINYEFLKQFETYLFGRKNTGGGVHHHMRTLRAIYNEAIKRKYIDSSYYPFSKGSGQEGYSLSKLKSIATPRALSANDLELLKNFDINKYPQFTDSYYLFMFSYYARGINFVDMAQLKKDNLYDDRLIYKRAKTGKIFRLKYNEKLRAIINYFDDPTSEYVFPILNSFHQTETQKKHRIHKRLRALNSDLKAMALILKIKVKVTSYVARHSYATTLLRQGVGFSMIGQGLGHNDIVTTNAYLAQFSDDELDKTDDLL
ncbi:site-specific recombinase XerD [Breznakibacter xylanolyticus]|uniref:Site-specific recombinase XerD n=1 Tax=Breznakibacter xylanolyticus TaxID=990 RepID=A0A2W7NTS6_9BACT|nr:site-specific integrase [Breznakibacter xylanolyticus]PZX20004.1 site-specific recombinase XerD [Breznakibacter xylanolyticus]